MILKSQIPAAQSDWLSRQSITDAASAAEAIATLLSEWPQMVIMTSTVVDPTTGLFTMKTYITIQLKEEAQ